MAGLCKGPLLNKRGGGGGGAGRCKVLKGVLELEAKRLSQLNDSGFEGIEAREARRNPLVNIICLIHSTFVLLLSLFFFVLFMLKL